MKVALVTDIHFGVRNDNTIFLDHQLSFFDKVFFPYLKKNKIDTIINLGDTFDRRKYINYNTLYHAKQSFFDVLQKEGMTMHVIVGNHDTTFKNTNEVNSPSLIFREYNNIVRYPKPTLTNIGGMDVIMMPWINQDNQEEAYKMMRSGGSSIMMGHFELSDQVLKGKFKFEHGVKIDDITKFEYVFSGHYHNRVVKKNFHYLGSPFHFDWGDAGMERGFHVFDTEKRTLKFVKNPNSLYQKVVWDDNGETTSGLDIVSLNPDVYKEKFVKVIVKSKANPYSFDTWIEAIENCGPHNVVIEEPNIHLVDEDVDVDSIEDTLTTLKKYINSSSEFENKDKLLYLMEELYNEALSTNI